MQESKRLHENEEVENVALIITDDEIEVIDDSGFSKGKISTKQLVKKALEKKTLKFRISEAMNIKITREEEESMPSLRDLYFDSHLLIYGKKADQVKKTGYVCPVCDLEIDEYGYCGCGSGSS
ncbi:sulfolobus mercury resistance protein, MerI [Sulfolobus tengchongensis]|uniref:Sulfolobus mercury resistance protein, MerI n=1 Tax=Sulfolobus tengchongensis TaxID=207809 RepID=A0AAX4L434_9CREN